MVLRPKLVKRFSPHFAINIPCRNIQCTNHKWMIGQQVMQVMPVAVGMCKCKFFYEHLFCCQNLQHAICGGLVIVNGRRFAITCNTHMLQCNHYCRLYGFGAFTYSKWILKW